MQENYIHSTNFCSFNKFIFIQQNHNYSFKNNIFIQKLEFPDPHVYLYSTNQVPGHCQPRHSTNFPVPTPAGGVWKTRIGNGNGNRNQNQNRNMSLGIEWNLIVVDTWKYLKIFKFWHTESTPDEYPQKLSMKPHQSIFSVCTEVPSDSELSFCIVVNKFSKLVHWAHSLESWLRGTVFKILDAWQ